MYNILLQLSSLYDVKPPISKAKIIQVTKTALKSLKYYKHVVHSVEKFIQKVRHVRFGYILIRIIIGSDWRPETKQGIEGKIVRFRSGRVRDRVRDEDHRSEPDR